ncbi:MAG TPA: FHA domain-containing protein [Pyrinomonadaceae bacterium]|jgi:predicted component of type VI protein secretion system|nr:FHA domain-containing protein [Pyrinomonadaceae bacterium]
MLPLRITLTFDDEGGHPRRVDVGSARFSIGRSSDNDLSINSASLSRRHAVIEVNNDAAFVSDCGSQNGTLVNGFPITGAARLNNGDVITLGGVFNISAAITHHAAPAAGLTAPVPSSSFAQQLLSSPPPAPASTAPTFWLTPPVIIAAAVSGIILLVAGMLVALTWNGESKSGSAARVANDDSQNLNVKDDNDERLNTSVGDGEDTLALASTPRADTPRGSQNANENLSVVSLGENPQASILPGDSAMTGGDSTRRVAQDAKRVLERISNGAASYIPPAGIESIAAQVNAYRGSAALAAKLQAMNRGCAGVKAQAYSNGLKPALVMYAALASSADGRSGDPVTTARAMIPELLTLRATFGTDTANSSLLLVAATAYEWRPSVGTTTRTPHPLASKLQEFGGRKSSVETATARSVWFLHEKNGISADAYDLVVRLLAVGIIAQNPQQYGINADSVLC